MAVVAGTGGASRVQRSDGGFQPCVACPHSVEWRDTPLEGRLIDSLGLGAAAEREMAAAAAEAAGAAATMMAATPGAGIVE
jgi:hypothetical protein